MTPTRFAKFFALLTIPLLVAGCVSPAQKPPASLRGAPTAISLSTAASTPTQTAETQLLLEIDQRTYGFHTLYTTSSHPSSMIIISKVHLT